MKQFIIHTIPKISAENTSHVKTFSPRVIVVAMHTEIMLNASENTSRLTLHRAPQKFPKVREQTWQTGSLTQARGGNAKIARNALKNRRSRVCNNFLLDELDFRRN